MWNNTRLLNLMASAMFALAALIIAKLAVIAFLNSPWFPVRAVSLSGELGQIAPDQLADAFAGRTMGNFFAVDLDTVRNWVESVPWVRRATVRRAWPDRLEVRVEAHHALARWSDRELVNTYGELFVADTRDKLPRFSGPAGTERDVTDRYVRFRHLLAAVHLEPVEVRLTARFAWEVKLADGALLALGRDGPKENADDRLERFVRVYPSTLARLRQRIDYIDLRYPNGFALRVPGLPDLMKDNGPAPVSPTNTVEPRAVKSASRGRAAPPA